MSPQTRLPRTCLSGVFLSVSGTKDGAGPEGDPFGGLPLAFDVDPGLAVVGVPVGPSALRVLAGFHPVKRLGEPIVAPVAEFGENLDRLQHVGDVAEWEAGLEPRPIGFRVPPVSYTHLTLPTNSRV